MENIWKNKKPEISEDEKDIKLEFNSEKEKTHLNLRKKKFTIYYHRKEK